MPGNLVTLLCSWGGHIKQGIEGIEYDGPPARVLRVSNGIKVNELTDKIYGLTGWDRRQCALEIICRYLVGVDPKKFIALHIVDDASVEAMFDMFSGPVRCVELYFEKKPTLHVQASAVGLSRPCTHSSTEKVDECTVPSSFESEIQVVNAHKIRGRGFRKSMGPNNGGGAVNLDAILKMVKNKDINSGAAKNTGTREIQSVLPGPDSVAVLKRQPMHRSEDVWDGQLTNLLLCRHHMMWPLHDDVRPFVQDAGFDGVSQIGHIPIDNALVTALVERWRQETHTFHFSVGEMTVTLQDVAILLGLRIDGPSITGPSPPNDWYVECERLLGLRPGDKAISGASLKLRWLSDHFTQFPQQADEQMKCYHARAYILYLFGAVLFTDTSGDTVPLMFLPLLEDLPRASSYSWGSATLAWLYRSLCRASHRRVTQLGGNLLLLQLWAWERLHIGRPHIRQNRTPQMHASKAGKGAGEGTSRQMELAGRPPLGAMWRDYRTFTQNPSHVLTFYRDQLDQQGDHQVIWQPYTSYRLQVVPPVCVDHQELWRARVPLICFAIIEWHFPDRVLRQFGMLQHIPEPCDTLDKLHSVDRRGRPSENWRDYHADYINIWTLRADHIVCQQTDDPHATKHYMTWYRSITRLRIGPPIDLAPAHPCMEYQPSASITHRLVEGVVSIAQCCAHGVCDTIDEASQVLLAEILGSCKSMLDDVGQRGRLERTLGELEPPVKGQEEQARVRGRGCGRQRDRVPQQQPKDFTVGPLQLTQDTTAEQGPSFSVPGEAGPSAAHEPEVARTKRKRSRTSRR